MISQKLLRKLFRYDPATGVFTHIHARQGVVLGTQAGCVYANGYRYISVLGRDYRANRLAWLYMTGEWPDRHVDHRNRKRDDDRWENLRLLTPAQNQHNRPATGVVRLKNGSWKAQIKTGGKHTHLVQHKCPVVAICAAAIAFDERMKVAA